MEKPFKLDTLSPEARAQVHGLVTPWKDNPEIMIGVYYWAGDLKSVELMPKGGKKFWNQLMLYWYAGKFLLKGFEINRMAKNYQRVKKDK